MGYIILQNTIGTTGHKTSIVHTTGYKKNLSPQGESAWCVGLAKERYRCFKFYMVFKKNLHSGSNCLFIPNLLTHFINHQHCCPQKCSKGSSAGPLKSTSCNANQSQHTTCTGAKATRLYFEKVAPKWNLVPLR